MGGFCSCCCDEEDGWKQPLVYEGAGIDALQNSLAPLESSSVSGSAPVMRFAFVEVVLPDHSLLIYYLDRDVSKLTLEQKKEQLVEGARGVKQIRVVLQDVAPNIDALTLHDFLFMHVKHCFVRVA